MRGLLILVFIGLMLVSCMENFPDREEKVTLFRRLVPEESGVTFINTIKETEQHNFLRYPYFYNGGGVAIGDLNNDGLPDLYFTGNSAGDHLYLNEGGLRFKDMTQQAGILSTNLWTTGVTFVDINNDGWLDIYVCRSGQGNFRNNLLYVNQQNGKFIEQAKLFGINDNGYSVQASFFDYDLDGDLDMYLVNHSVRFFENQELLFSLKDNPSADEADRLYRNDGVQASGNILFTDVSRDAGITHFAFGLSASVGDFNLDGFPDLYVASDFFEPDFLYINDGKGHFVNQIDALMGHTSFSSMGTDIADFNNDGMPDIMVCDMQASDNYRKKANMASMDTERFARMQKEGYHFQYMQNTLQLNTGQRFSEIAELAMVAETDWSWGPLFFDMDNDGWKDLFVSNGIRRDIQYKDVLTDLQKTSPNLQQISTMDIVNSFPVERLKNYSFQNNRDLRFIDQSDLWGIDFKGFSTGAAYGDLDQDGDLDLVLNNLDDVASIYENCSDERQHANYLQIKLTGTQDNRYGLGATIKIRSADDQQYQYLQATRGFQSAVEPIVHFGVGKHQIIDEIEVRWPNGTFSLLQDVSINQQITIKQENTISKENQVASTPIFSDQAPNLNLAIQHIDMPYDDFAREILLPHKYSQLGPSISVADVNGDMLDDVYIGGATGQPGSLLIQTTDGKFNLSFQNAFLSDKIFEDVGSIFFDADGDGDQDLFVVSGSNEWMEGSKNYQHRLYINDGHGHFKRSITALPEISQSGACVSPADFDGDGDLDLFLGGRLVPGKYPLPPPSYLLENNGGVFTDITQDVFGAGFNPGLVTDAAWIDFDQDHDLDLILVGEWMPITIYSNDGGRLQRIKNDVLDSAVGWWYCLEVGDFDHDGDFDMVAGNLGLNYKYRASLAQPFQVFAHDFDDNQSLDIVLGYFNDGQLFPLRGRQCSSQQMPFIKEKFPSYSMFASATLSDIYGPEMLDNALHYQANTFASSFIENLGEGQFAIRQLPMEAQLSSVNDILVEDLNKDGHPDLILAGNMFQAEAETARNDAGQGVVLLGDGKGSFANLSSVEHGFVASGDVKSLTTLKLADSRQVILVGNNAGLLQAFVRKDDIP